MEGHYFKVIEMQRVKFFKESKTPDELIEQLVKRGMVITNRDYAKDILFKNQYPPYFWHI